MEISIRETAAALAISFANKGDAIPPRRCRTFLFLSIDNVKNAAFTDGSSRLIQSIYSVMDPLSLDWMIYSSHSSPGRAWIYDIWTPTKEYHPGQKIPIVLHSKHPLAMDFDNGNGPTIEVYTKMADGKENPH